MTLKPLKLCILRYQQSFQEIQHFFVYFDQTGTRMVPVSDWTLELDSRSPGF